MIEVAIKAVEAVFDWKAYLQDEFGYEIDESWLDDEPASEEVSEDGASEDEASEGKTSEDEMPEDEA